MPSSSKWRLHFTAYIGGNHLNVAEFALYDSGGANLCTGGTPSASGDDGVGYTADKAFDGNASTYWMMSVYGVWPQWLQYEFASPVNPTHYSIRTGPDYSYTPKSWTLEYWNGTTWVTAGEAQAEVTDWQTTGGRSIRYFPLASKYGWRVYITAPTTFGDRIALAEIQLRTVSGGSNHATVPDRADDLIGYNDAGYALDGDAATEWQSTEAMPAIWQYVFPSARTIVEYTLQASADSSEAAHWAPKDFVLQYFDGTSWVTVNTQTDQPTWGTSETRTYTIPQPAAFSNAQLTVGLTWLELTTPSGATPTPFTDRPLPDPHSYYRGWKEPRVIEWGKIRRALSAFNGEYETSDFQITCSDTDRLLRGLDDDNDLVNASVVVRMIDDVGRRALDIPRVVYRGVVRDIAPKGGLQYQITIKDPYAEVFSASGQANPLPRRTITITDFPNCAQTVVASSASGYQTAASALAGVGTVTVDTGVGQFASGDLIRFAGHGTLYTVSTSSWADPETSVTFTPDLTDAVADNEAITVLPSHTVSAAVGQRVPVVYGHITDRNVVDGLDVGDGQGPVIYVGDRELADGKTYGEFLWAGHACYGGGGSPSDQPFPMLYFFNEALDDLAGGTFYHDGVLLTDLTLGDLATEAASGGRIALPGYSNWTDLGFIPSYRDYNGRRYTVFFLTGILRDWALGIAPPPDYLGGVPLSVDGYGCEDVGDGTSALIGNGLLQYLHAITNWCPPAGDGYQGGAWLSIPQWPDGTPMIDADSFTAADTQSAVYATDGFRGDFIIGANNEAVSARQLLARFNLSFGVDSGFNRNSQYFVSLIARDLESVTLQTALGWVRDIFSKTFSVESRTRELYTVIPFRHTQDYLRRDPSGWRSVQSGETEVENTAMSTLYGARTSSPELDLYMVRGQNRESDPDEYSRGTETAAAVLDLKLARYSRVQHLASLQTGPAGFQYELGEVVPITHYEGVGVDGWIDVPTRIERIEIDPGSYTTTLETYDLTPALG